MKARTLNRLEIMAISSEMKCLEDIARHNATLEKMAQQRQLLAGYRQKLGDSWRNGDVVDAGAARRAAEFIAASRKADVQIEQIERTTRQQVDVAQRTLAQTKERRRHLSSAQREANLATERALAVRLERAQVLAAKKSSKSD